MGKRRKGRQESPAPPAPPRKEAEILADLKSRCGQRGFAHAVAIACMRDDLVTFKDEVTAEDMTGLYGADRLIRTEVMTLVGYMVQAGDEPFQHPERQPLEMLGEAEALLEELHRRLDASWHAELKASLENQTPRIPRTAEAMREPIFYSGEAAFSFQYLDLALLKYRNDNTWLQAQFGFQIEDAVSVAKAIQDRVLDGVATLVHQLLTDQEASFSVVDPYRFSVEEIATRASLTAGLVENVLKAFSQPEGPSNLAFNALSDFNEANARPLVRSEGRYCSFKHYALLEAIYESPFYWMCQDKAYRPKADVNRGDFLETFVYDRLTSVFGPNNVRRNVNLYRGKGDRLGEIDILVNLGGRAIVVQCKSKRLTLEAKVGNDLALSRDFHGAFQHAYNQALVCAESLSDPSVRLVGDDGTTVLPHAITRILPLCVVADNYPALSMQIDQFLERRDVAGVLPALFTDVFTLDAMAEMLDRPLHFLNYLELRARFGEKLVYTHEATLLSYHLKYNLWMSDDYDLVSLGDDFAADLEIAMLARRTGMPGAKTPKGILTAMAGTSYDALIRRVELGDRPELVDLGMLLLQISGVSAKELSKRLDMIVAATREDGGLHDFSLAFPPTGVTMHCSYAHRQEAAHRLEGHCVLRKYDTKADVWHGVWLSPSDGLPQFGIKLEFPWVPEPEVGRALINMQLASADRPGRSRRVPTRTVGRNDPCPCGSGMKFKKCCLAQV